MLKNIIISCLFVLLAGCAPKAPQNLDAHKKELVAYYDSGAYQRDFDVVLQNAERYIVGRAGSVSRPAIVLDIDETSLSNWPELMANGLTFRVDGACNNLPKGPCGLKAWQQKAQAEGYAATLHLFQQAQAHKVAIFFLTGRDETLRRATERNLRAAGYKDWQELILRLANTTTPSAVDYKAPQRARIESLGYTILATIGDQQSDLEGGHAQRTFLAPNPFYLIP